MKKNILISLTIAGVFACFALPTHAASTAAEKPRCKPGQVAKADARGNWSCAPLFIKAQPTSTPSSSAPTPKPVPSSRPPKPSMMPTAVGTSKPDLVIMDILKVQGYDNRFQVRVQNIGKVTASGAVLLGEDTTGLGGGGTKPIPTLTPNSFSAIIFDVPSANIDHGDRIKFEADAYKKVAESNENNNVKYFNVP